MCRKKRPHDIHLFGTGIVIGGIFIVKFCTNSLQLVENRFISRGYNISVAVHNIKQNKNGQRDTFKSHLFIK